MPAERKWGGLQSVRLMGRLKSATLLLWSFDMAGGESVFRREGFKKLMGAERDVVDVTLGRNTPLAGA